MPFDRIPYQLLDVGSEGDIITWDNTGEPSVLSLGIGDLLYRDATGALAAIGNGATANQVIVADGLGNWLLADQSGGGPGSGIGVFDVNRQLYAAATPQLDPLTEFEPGVTTEIQLPIEPTSEVAVVVFFDGAFQGNLAFDITDNINPTVFDTVTFTDPIPAGITNVEALIFNLPTAAAIIFDPLNLPTIIATGTNVQEVIEQLDTYLANLNATQVSFDDTQLGAGATNVQEAIDAMATTPGLLPTPFVDLFMLLTDERPIDTDGGTASSGNWNTRILNTENVNGIAGATLAANRITLPDGEYHIEFDSVFNTDAQGPLGMVRTRFHNITDNIAEVLSMSEAVDGGAQQQANAISKGCGRFTVAGGPKEYELQYQVEYTRQDRGLGVASGFDTEIYAIVKIWKVG
jgi:hypothetical protein